MDWLEKHAQAEDLQQQSYTSNLLMFLLKYALVGPARYLIDHCGFRYYIELQFFFDIYLIRLKDTLSTTEKNAFLVALQRKHWDVLDDLRDGKSLSIPPGRCWQHIQAKARQDNVVFFENCRKIQAVFPDHLLATAFLPKTPSLNVLKHWLQSSPQINFKVIPL